MIAAALVAVLNILALIPAMREYQQHFLAGAIALATWLALKAATGKPPSSAPSPAPSTEPAAPPRMTAEAEVITLLGLFQEKGRFIDFLMDDVTAYSDAQVGAAARVVHQGCKTVLKEHIDIEPISTEAEGKHIDIPQDAPSAHYRFVGKVTEASPRSGTLVHKGWKAGSVRLPRTLKPDDASLPPIAPAQIEVK